MKDLKQKVLERIDETQEQLKTLQDINATPVLIAAAEERIATYTEVLNLINVEESRGIPPLDENIECPKSRILKGFSSPLDQFPANQITGEFLTEKKLSETFDRFVNIFIGGVAQADQGDIPFNDNSLESKQRELKEALGRQDYEKAAELRDQIKNIKK